MKKHVIAAIVAASTTMLTLSQAEAVIIDTYFGWNYVNSSVLLPGETVPTTLPETDLTSITYLGAGGTTHIQAMPTSFPPFTGMPDGVGNTAIPTYTTAIGGDGETTRTVSESLPIDWYEAGDLTPWGTFSFPTIGITSVTVPIPTETVAVVDAYVVGLIPSGGSDSETLSTLSGPQGDIYNNPVFTFNIDPTAGITGTGDVIFAAAAVPLPAAVWLFGSGILGLIGISRRKKVA